MARKRYIPRPVRRHEPVTPQIIQGGWTDSGYPGTPEFASNCAQLARAFRRGRHRKRKQPIAELFRVVETRSRILSSTPECRCKVVPLLVQAASKHEQWARNLASWQPKTHDACHQVRELVTHLFEKYPTPEFLYRSWRPFNGEGRDWLGFDWYIHMAGGGSVRTAPRIPASLNRRAAHEMKQAPRTLRAMEAVRWGQVRALGMAEHVAWEVIGSAACDDFANDHVWLALFAKISETPHQPWTLVEPLVDFVSHRLASATPDKPFTLKRRPLAAIVRAMQRWHIEIGQEARALERLGAKTERAQQLLRKSVWAPLDGARSMRRGKGNRVWEIVELCSFVELLEEGTAMRHCVVEQVPDCARGESSIWSLRALDRLDMGERVTIRVETDKRGVVEARGFANGPITAAAMGRLRMWAHENALEVGSIPVQAN